MGRARKTNIGGFLACDEGSAKPQTAADDTYIVGATIDRLGSQKVYDSLVGLVNVAFTAASGASGAKNTLTITVYEGDESNMSDEASYDSDTYVYTWVADGANSGIHCINVNLHGAKRYVRIKAKLTESGTITISSQSLAIAAVCASNPSPDSAYVDAGYESTTEPTA